MSEGLKPCPFCGGSNLNNDSGFKNGYSTASVYCKDCGIFGEDKDAPTAHEAQQVAAEAWNTRTPSQPEAGKGIQAGHLLTKEWVDRQHDWAEGTECTDKTLRIALFLEVIKVLRGERYIPGLSTAPDYKGIAERLGEAWDKLNYHTLDPGRAVVELETFKALAAEFKALADLKAMQER